MYLSRVFLHPGKLNNAYEWHRALWTLFPDVERGSASPFLYHIESINLSAGAQLLVQSSVEPLIASAQAKVLASKLYPITFEEGQRLSFRLLANPSKRISDTHGQENKKNQGKCRVPLIKEDEQANWLQRKLTNAANIREVVMQRHAPVYFRKGRRAGKVVPVLFEGILDVTNAEVMTNVWEKGMGPAKAFGCGMLLVRRA